MMESPIEVRAAKHGWRLIWKFLNSSSFIVAYSALTAKIVRFSLQDQ